MFMSDPPRSTHPRVLASRMAARWLDGRGVAGWWPGGRTMGRRQGDGAAIGPWLGGRVASQRKGIGLDGASAVKLWVGGRATAGRWPGGRIAGRRQGDCLAAAMRHGERAATGQHLGGRATSWRKGGWTVPLWPLW